MARTGQVASSFAVVVAAYTLYWLLVVPLIEPSLEEKVTTRASEAEIKAAQEQVGARQHEMARYFPPDSWELKNPAIWESDQTRLLFKTLKPLPDGNVELKPCTLLFFSKGSAANPTAPKQPIIMRAVEGAIIRFDEPIVLKNVDLSERELVGGLLPGVIRIYRSPSAPNAGDDLEITTRDVEMLNDRVWTPHPVQFRLGRNHGSGREMEIMLATADPASKGAFRTGTMRTLQLKREVKMQFELAGSPLAQGATPTTQHRPEPPLEITCKGPFQFEMQTHTASFHEEVDVLWPSLAGEARQLNCTTLSVLFDPRAAKPGAPTPAPTAGAAQLSSLQVRVIQARGDPVTVRAPMQGIYARCHGIDYAPNPSGAAGNFLAIGPGFMRRHLPSDPDGTYDVAWAREFRFEPEGPQHLATLRGAATVRFAQMGKITADEILAWVTPTEPPPGQHPEGAQPGAAEWQLERVVAQIFPNKASGGQGPVVIDAPQLMGRTDQLEARVERSPTETPAAQASPAAGAAGAPSAERTRNASQQPSKPSQRYEVSGRRMQIKLLPNADQLAVSDVTIENQAHLQELVQEREGQRPLVVHGDRLHVANAHSDLARVTVSGQPGHLEAGGLTLEGRNIEMEQKTNRLWIDGPGRMTMPIEQDLNGQPIARPQVLTVTWQGGMNFQAQTVVFRNAVEAQSEHQFLGTEKLEAVLTRPIDFSSTARPTAERREDRPQLAKVRSYGPTFLQSRELDERGEQTSLSRVKASDLAIEHASGAIEARGPGSVTRVARGSIRPLEARGGAAAPQRPPAANQAGPDELTYLNVAFQNSITGNLHRREISFGDATKTVYGPVKQWDATLNADTPGGLGPQGMVLEAKQLAVREMPSRDRDKRGWIELEAQRNVVAEGSGFTARGDRLTYSQEKDQLVLRGDGFSPAEFFQEDASGGPRRESTANELTYWIGLERLLVTGFKSFGVDVPKNPATKPAGK